MAPNQRLSSRFFAAFYHWNRFTQHHACPRALRCRRNAFQHLARVGGSRPFVTSSRYRQPDTSPAQKVEEAALAANGAPAEESGATSGEAPPAEVHDIGESVRLLMRNVAHPVAIITAAHHDPNIHGPAPLGMAVSSFNTVTLDPPTISFNVRQPSRTLDAIRADRGRLRVHIMLAAQEGATAASLFAGPNNTEAFRQRLKTAPLLLSDTESAKPQELDASEAAALDCELSAEFDVADHKIVVAKVTNATTSMCPRPSLQYVQGTYQTGSDASLFHGTSQLEKKENASAEGSYKYAQILPFVVRESDRHMFAKRLEEYMKEHPQLRDVDLPSAEHQVRTYFGLPQGALGISVRQIIARTLDHPGLPDYEKDVPVFYDFYEQVSPEGIKTMASRIQRLVEQDSDYLALPYKSLLELIGCHYKADYLPSQLLGRLRKQGVVGKFQPLPDHHVISPDATATLELLEQVEYRLRKHLKTSNPSLGHQMLSSSRLVKAVGAPETLVIFVQAILNTLMVEEHPSFYVKESVNISGELDEQEARVVVYRVYCHIRAHPLLYTHANSVIRREIALRNCHVHPLIGGALNARYMFKKIKALRSLASHDMTFLNAVREEVERLFDPDFEPTYSALKDEVDTLVEKNPLRAVQWSEADIAVWAGILPESKIVRDDIKGSPTQTLRSGYMHGIVWQALRSKYPDRGPEPDPLIAAFLKARGEEEDKTTKLLRRKYVSGGNPDFVDPSTNYPSADILVHNDMSSQDTSSAHRLESDEVRDKVPTKQNVKREQLFQRLRSMVLGEEPEDTDLENDGPEFRLRKILPNVQLRRVEVNKDPDGIKRLDLKKTEEKEPREIQQEAKTSVKMPPARGFGFQAYGEDGKRVII
ncbi:flavin reductase like domain-containing protein [Lophiotrema nucula]|uniref:Flavin reductase like domain-containing protein n=1 Tax=Lophiotrema nucula TaxID=690887 RepID=A0A6A5ZRL1_9PLEO|nr:flavin reductase like domain-containing protein [Lophiotrema nucula]